ncbi:MAG: phosphotransferase [Thermoclostridium sp.]|nr:phosphotransferase [Thermoclostridium sp.]
MDINKARVFKSKSQISLTFCEIEGLVQSLFGNHEKLLSAEVASAGDVNSCYVLKTSSFQNKVFLKIEKESIPKFYDGQVAKEAAAIKLCTENNVPVAKVITYEAAKKNFGYRFMMTEFVEGEMLSKVWGKLDGEQKKAVKSSCLSLLNRFKQIRSPYFGDICDNGSFGKHSSWKDAFIKISSVAIKDCYHMGSLSQYDADIVQEAVIKCSESIKAAPFACFNHMDLHWNNIIVSQQPDGGIAFRSVLDFGSSVFGPEYSDEIRINKGFFYMTEDFYDETFKLSDNITFDEIFSSKLLSFLDYYVFLTLMGNYEAEKENLIKTCMAFIQGTQNT